MHDGCCDLLSEFLTLHRNNNIGAIKPAYGFVVICFQNF